MTDREWILNIYERHMGPRYAESLKAVGLDRTVAEANGALIRDAEGREYIDFVAGFGVFNFGHNPPAVIRALRQELDSSPLWNRPFLSERFAEVADRLVSIAPEGLDRVILTSTGSEAVESAIKLARLSTGRSRIIAAAGGFHGYTLGALSVSGIPSQSRLFRPLLPDVEHVPFGDASAMAAALEKETAAVILEAIQAEIGAIEPPKGYLSEVRNLCDRHGVLLIVDEVRTGMGRVGPLFAVEDEGVVPDILLVGKALAAGIVPIGALIAPARLWARVGLSFAMTASSFGGNRLACTAALATLDLLANSESLAQGRRNSAILTDALANLGRSMPEFIASVTGRGLLLGLHFETPGIASDVVRRCAASGVLTATAFCNRRCVLLEPPLVMDEELARRGVQLLAQACRAASLNQQR
jgi:putrescine aminotransferase